MDVVAMVLGAGLLLVAAYFSYGSWLSRRVFRLDDANTTPAVSQNDGVDFVPTKKSIIFGHHFTSIAGTGPIVGPAIAVMWGWLPALLWVVFGSIFIGAVHDLGAIVVSLRKKGRSIGDIAGDLLGPRARLIFLGILVLGLWLVLAVFGLVIASVLRQYPAAIFPVVVQVPLAMAVGWALRKGRIGIAIPSVIALGLMYASVIWGDVPAIHGFNVWMAALPLWMWVIGLLAYAAVASVIPVWVLLQPRDYINALQLVTALGLLVVGLGVAAIVHRGGGAPAPSPLEGEGPAASAGGEGYFPSLSLVAPMIDWNPPGAPPLIPILFITVACGACSGFHCLVGSGTTSKQLARERDAKAVGYGSMLTEGFLAVIVIAACAGGIGLGVFDEINRAGWRNGIVRHFDGEILLNEDGSPYKADTLSYAIDIVARDGLCYRIANHGGAQRANDERLIVQLGHPQSRNPHGQWSILGRELVVSMTDRHFDAQRGLVESKISSQNAAEANAWKSVLLAWDEYSHSANSHSFRDEHGCFVNRWLRLPEGLVRVSSPDLPVKPDKPTLGLAGNLAFSNTYESWQSSSGLGSTVGAFVEGGANFLTALAIPRHIAIALMAVMVASFAATTMDTSCRLQRYVVQELGRVMIVGRRARHAHGSCPGCGYDLTGIDPVRAVTHDGDEAHTRCPECNALSTPAQRSSEGVVAAALARASGWNPCKWLTTSVGATLFAVVTALALAFIPPSGQAWSLANAGMGAMVLWPLFGAVNQLLAGFAFVVIIAWLRLTGRPWWFAVVPAVLMLVLPAWAMVWQMAIGNAENQSWIAGRKWPLVAAGAIALALEAWLVAEAVVRWRMHPATSPLGGEVGTSAASDG